MAEKIVLIGRECDSTDLACAEKAPYSFLRWECVSEDAGGRKEAGSPGTTGSLGEHGTVFFIDAPFVALLSFSEFESKILGKRIVRAVVMRCKGSSGDKSEDEVRSIIDRIVKTSVDKWSPRTVILRVARPSAVDISGFSRYARLGDILITLFYSRSSLKEQDNNKNMHEGFKVILASRFMEEFSCDKNTLAMRLEELSKNTFTQSHYYVSGLFTWDEADRIYCVWARNAVEENADKLLLLVDEKGGINGYIANRTVTINGSSYGVIDLITISREYRGRGFGRLLVREAVRYLITTYGVQGVFVGTQLTNTAALRTYNSCGFNIVGHTATYHVPVY